MHGTVTDATSSWEVLLVLDYIGDPVPLKSLGPDKAEPSVRYGQKSRGNLTRGRRSADFLSI